MKLIRLVMCAVIMGSMLNAMAMEKEIIQQKRAAAVKRYRNTKNQRKIYAGLRNERFLSYFDFLRLLELLGELFDEKCIQDLSLIDEEDDSQEEKDKALHRLVEIYNRQGFYEHGETLMNAIKTVVAKGADPNLENDTESAGYPLYIALKKEKNDDLLQLLFTHGAHTDLSKAAVWVREVFEEYNKNQKELKNESINN